MIWFYMSQSIHKWAKQNLWKIAFKKFEGIWKAAGLKEKLQKNYFAEQIWKATFAPWKW